MGMNDMVATKGFEKDKKTKGSDLVSVNAQLVQSVF
jgi:hypothetical protein